MGEHPRGDVIERLVPPHTLPSARAPPERKADPLGIDVDVLERVALGADMAAREVVVLVPTYGHHVAIHMPDLQPTHRLAQRARAVVHAGGLLELGAGDGHNATYRIFPDSAARACRSAPRDHQQCLRGRRLHRRPGE
jgi:hypothetical protein